MSARLFYLPSYRILNEEEKSQTKTTINNNNNNNKLSLKLYAQLFLFFVHRIKT